MRILTHTHNIASGLLCKHVTSGGVDTLSLHPKQRGGADTTYSGKIEKIHTFDQAVSLNIHTLLCFWTVGAVVLKMGQLTVVAVLAVLITLFMETAANPFVYNYEGLRIGGLVFTGLLVAGALGFLFYNTCHRRNKKGEDSSEIWYRAWETGFSQEEELPGGETGCVLLGFGGDRKSVV